MLGADLFALSAADAGGSLAMAAVGDDAIVHARIPIVEHLMGVHCGKNVRDENVLGAMVFIDTVAIR